MGIDESVSLLNHVIMRLNERVISIFRTETENSQLGERFYSFISIRLLVCWEGWVTSPC